MESSTGPSKSPSRKRSGASATASSGSRARRKGWALNERLGKIFHTRELSPDEREAMYIKAQAIGPWLARNTPLGLVFESEELTTVVDRSFAIAGRHVSVTPLLHPDAADGATIAGTIWTGALRVAMERMQAQQRQPAPPSPPQAPPAPLRAARPATVQHVKGGKFVPGEGPVEEQVDQFVKVLAENEPEHPQRRAASGGS